MSHFIKKCECGITLSQCRCPDPNKTVEIVRPCNHQAQTNSPQEPNQYEDKEVRRVTDWQWLTELLSDFDITEKRTMRKNTRGFTSLEARLYRCIQNLYKPRKKANYIVTANGGRTSKQYEDAKRIHANQINTMHEMGYGLMLDGFTFYKYGHELEPYDFETNFNMHQAYEIHKFITQHGIQKRIDDNRKWQKLVLDRQALHSSAPYIGVLEYEKHIEELTTQSKGSE